VAAAAAAVAAATRCSCAADTVSLMAAAADADVVAAAARKTLGNEVGATLKALHHAGCCNALDCRGTDATRAF
jgi:hypothetical protein